MEKSGIYTCKTCRERLFSSSERVGASTNSLAFKKPITEEKLQTRKNEQGQWLVRCAKCHSGLGSLIGGKSPHYRIQSAETNFVEDDLDIELPEFEDNEDEKKDEQDNKVRPEASRAPLNALSLFVAGAAVGGIVGATAAFLICRNLEAPLVASNLGATSTALEIGSTNVVSPGNGTRPTPPPSPVFTPLPPSGTSPATTAAATSSDGSVPSSP